MRIGSEERPLFDSALDRLVADGVIERGDDKKLRLPKMPEEITGSYKQNPRGFGFIRPEGRYREGDLFVPAGRNGSAVTGDTVRATVIRQSWRQKAHAGRSETIGEIVEVLERGNDQFVGVLIRNGKQYMVEPDGRRLHEPLIIRDPHAKNAKVGDKVVVKMVHFPEGDFFGEAVITRVLGEAGEPDVETQAVIQAHGLRTEFPSDADSEADDAARRFDEATADPNHEREDLTERFIFTIDPPDARDFDDAISIDWDEDAGEWTLGVHIADVAFFVTPGSALDTEAQQRGNSVYLPRHVIPMLPEVLSNGVCSLQEGVPRFTKSVFITFDTRGRVLQQRLARTMIRSAKRLTYLEAQALIDGDQQEARKHSRTSPVYEDELIAALQRANTLSRTLRKRRLHDGQIVLDLPDVELVFDEDGNVTDAVPEDDAFTHTLIEMFMVEANEAIARTFDDLGIPILRRIHPDPSFGDMTELQQYARAMHFTLPDEPTREDMQRLLDATRDNPAGRAIHFAVLRTLSKASYSPAVVGHFALASAHYAHFTSPIRRYPDLTVHRVMDAFLDQTDNGTNVPGGRKRQAVARRVLDDSRTLPEDALITLGRTCSDTEVAAADAERELRDYLVMKFLHDHHLGATFSGVVTGAIGRGVFVSIEQFLVEGLVAFRDLPGARGTRWREDDRTGRLVSSADAATIGVGDSVMVQIVAVDLGARSMELRVTEILDAGEVRIPGFDRKGPRRGSGKGGGDRSSKHGRGGGRSKSSRGKSAGKGPGKGRGGGKRGGRRR